MQNKKTIMAFSALLILLFHLWINITNYQVESYLRELCVIGVDLFFFISAYSIGKKDTLVYNKFLKNRFLKVYLKFIIFAIIGLIYYKWDIVKFIRIISGLELFSKGGGSFLWFLPCIMLVYLTLPLYKELDKKYPKLLFGITILSYLLIVIGLSLYTDIRQVFIFLNRIPIILIGYYVAKYNILEYLNHNKIKYIITTITTLVIGLIITYLAYINHFSLFWYREVFYILYIPLSLGLILVLDKIKPNKLITLISSITLELYGLQMIFGFKLANKVFTIIDMKLLSNIITIVILIIMARAIKYLFDLKEKIKR